jgi:hypothetical protein
MFLRALDYGHDGNRRNPGAKAMKPRRSSGWWLNLKRVERDGTTECLSARLAVDRNLVAASKLDADVELLPLER